jgi:hypothetical protein
MNNLAHSQASHCIIGSKTMLQGATIQSPDKQSQSFIMRSKLHWYMYRCGAKSKRKTLFLGQASELAHVLYVGQGCQSVFRHYMAGFSRSIYNRGRRDQKSSGTETEVIRTLSRIGMAPMFYVHKRCKTNGMKISLTIQRFTAPAKQYLRSIQIRHNTTQRLESRVFCTPVPKSPSICDGHRPAPDLRPGMYVHVQSLLRQSKPGHAYAILLSL